MAQEQIFPVCFICKADSWNDDTADKALAAGWMLSPDGSRDMCPEDFQTFALSSYGKK